MSQNLSKTYKDVAKEFIEEAKEVSRTEGFSADEVTAITLFAAHLDSNNVMNDQMALLVMQKARELDRELLLAFIEVVGHDKAAEIALQVNNNHKKWRREVPLPNGGKSSKSEQKRGKESTRREGFFQ